MMLLDPSPTAPARGVVSVPVHDGDGDGDGDEAGLAGRLEAELRGRIAVGTQLLIVDVGRATFFEDEMLSVLVQAAQLLQDERAGSVVLRNATAPLLRQLRMLRLDHVFELEL